ncbi:MAG: peptidylprolyl isomerase [Bacteroidales bacterium]|nr:peptidylprolyl isomerase [Bacteroidales bacterium]
MKVEKNKAVAISYTLVTDGKVADHAGSESPLQYVHGTGMLLPKFEEALEGKEEGDSFEFTLSPEDGYGVFNPSLLIDLPKTAFMVDGVLREDLLVEGTILPMYNQDGQMVRGCVSKVGEDKVTMDFNHPMAGKTLNFSGKIEKVCEHECHKHEGEGCCGKHEGKGCCGKHCNEE